MKKVLKMNETQFHKRIKEILSVNRSPYNSPDQQFHEMMSREVKSRSKKEWDEDTAAQVIREFEWATNTQPKRDDIPEPDIKGMIGEFVRERGYMAIPITEGTEKTPDFRVEKNGLKYLVEVKSPILNFNVEKQLYMFKTSHTKILNHIHTAIKQFTEQDNNHELPWILLFTSSHAQLNWSTFVDVLRGAPVDEYERSAPAYRSTVPLIEQIDGFIWLQASGPTKTFHQASYMVNTSSVYRDNVQKLNSELSATRLAGGMDNSLKVDIQSGSVNVSRI